MAVLHSASFQTDGWTLAEDSETQRAWTNPVGDVLSLHYFPKVPDLAAPLADIARIRDAYRAMLVRSGGALVEADVSDLAGNDSLRTILKFPQHPHGMAYVGAWTIPK